MKKILFIALALTLALGQVCFADVQINEGQSKDQAAIKFFVGRVTGSELVSADRVVVWDSTSKDGVTVKTTTTSGDKLVAGIAMDTIYGISSDSLSADVGKSNWGRIQTWGLYQDAHYATGTAASAGATVCASSTAGSLTACSANLTSASADKSSVGVALEADSSNAVDIMVNAD